MPLIDLLSDDLALPDTQPVEETSVGEQQLCPGCLGKGRYVGLTKVEDPCLVCGGTGTVPLAKPLDEPPE